MNFRCSLSQHLTVLLGASLVVVLMAGTSYAGPRSGFSVYGSYVNRSTQLSQRVATTNGGNFSEATLSTTQASSGGGLGLDYQFATGKWFSIVPFYQYSSESNKGGDGSVDLDNGSTVTITGTTSTVVHHFAGSQFRFWPGDNFYFGPEIGYHSETFSGGGSNVTGTGIGGGLVIGFETDGGFQIFVQIDTMTADHGDNITNGGTATRLNAGYRF